MSHFVEVKTQDLSGAALDWVVSGFVCPLDVKIWSVLGKLDGVYIVDDSGEQPCKKRWSPSSDWSQGGPLIASLQGMEISGGKRVRGVVIEKLEHWYSPDKDACRDWLVKLQHDDGAYRGVGDSLLEAACRAIVSAVLGDTVNVLKVLLP